MCGLTPRWVSLMLLICLHYPDFYSKGAGAIVTEVPDEYLERAANSYYNSNRKAKLDMAFAH